MSAAAELYDSALVWDQHGCLPLEEDADLSQLDLYREAGVDFVSVNVGFDPVPWTQTVKVLAAFRRGLLADPQRFVAVRTVDDVREAKATGRLAVAFDLEGTEPLDGSLALVEAYYELGVRTMLMAYNQRNRAAGGCHDADGEGLTPFGRALVAEMNRVGMLVDAAHCSYRTTMELFEASESPVVFSHANPRALWDHERNLRDDQIRACADQGGVIGVNGVGIFLGDNDSSTETLARHVDYVVQLVGPEHVGIGLDYVFDQEELNRYLRESPEVFPAGKGYTGHSSFAFVSPAQLPELAALLHDRGYADDDLRAVLGGNFLRVAELVWR